MTIDEFLESNENIGKIDGEDFIKIKYNENLDFIYKPSWGKLEYGNNLEFLGIFEKITKKLYGSSFEFSSRYNKEKYSQYYISSIDNIAIKLLESSNKYLDSYIKDNQIELMNIGRNIFNEFILDERNYERIRDDCIHDYIYQDNQYEPSFSVKNFSSERHSKDLILEYIQNPIAVAKSVFEKCINNTEKIERVYYNNKYHEITVKEWIGFKMQESEFAHTLQNEIRNNPSLENKKKHDITESIKNLDAQMLTITLKHNNQTISFKYPKRCIFDLDYFEYQIPDLKIREKVQELYRNINNKDNVFVSEILKIEYNRKVIYEDNKLLELNSNLEKENQDITDEMFG